MKTFLFFFLICNAFLSFSQEIDKKLTIQIKPNARENSFQIITNERRLERKELRLEHHKEARLQLSEKRVRPHFEKVVEHHRNERELPKKELNETRKERIRERKEHRLEILRNRRN